jgi:hypothetical protein
MVWFCCKKVSSYVRFVIAFRVCIGLSVDADKTTMVLFSNNKKNIRKNNTGEISGSDLE